MLLLLKEIIADSDKATVFKKKNLGKREKNLFKIWRFCYCLEEKKRKKKQQKKNWFLLSANVMSLEEDWHN